MQKNDARSNRASQKTKTRPGRRRGFCLLRISGKIGWTEIINDILRPLRLWCLCLPGLRPEPFRSGKSLCITDDDPGVAGKGHEWKNHGRPWPCEREGPKLCLGGMKRSGSFSTVPLGCGARRLEIQTTTPALPLIPDSCTKKACGKQALDIGFRGPWQI